MRLIWASILISALLATGCADRTAGVPQATTASEQPAEVSTRPPGESGAVRAVSPFGSRQVVEPSRNEYTIPRGTVFRVRLTRAVDTAASRAGDHFTATLDNPVLDGTRVVVPRGTLFNGHLTSAKSSGRLRGRAVLGLTLDSLELAGVTYPVVTSAVSRTSGDHKRRNVGLIGGGSGLGAVLGAIAGGPQGALIGAGAGAAAGTAGAAITGKKNLRLPAEALLAFSLEKPLVI
ncbi:MAG TPA: hypothetical protein VN442_08990 [Bryobacteraceae bacterium]|nr:hypothetical protein [Bryobacteraceae bacterium]